MGEPRPINRINAKTQKIEATYESISQAARMTGHKMTVLRYITDTHRELDGYVYETVDKNRNKVIFVKCVNCGAEVGCQEYRIDKSESIFCNNTCQAEYVKAQTASNKNCTCSVCGKQFHRKISDIHKHNFCSEECERKWRSEYYSGEGNHQYGLKGRLNSSWKCDKRISSYGYWLIRSLNHPFKNGDDMVFEHRLVAEKYLLTDKNSIEINGVKYLSPEYEVHHLDFNRINNQPQNLLVLKKSEHIQLHIEIKKLGRLERYCKEYKLDYQEVINNMKKYSKQNMKDNKKYA